MFSIKSKTRKRQGDNDDLHVGSVINVQIPKLNCKVKLKRLKNKPNACCPIRFQCNIPLFHPALHDFTGEIAGKTVVECIADVTEVTPAFSNPYNIEASIMWRRDFDKLKKLTKA